MNRSDDLPRHSTSVARVGLVVVALQLLVATVSLFVLSAVRAYVAGESLYSKGQKDAVIHLQWYVQSHQEPSFEAFLAAMRVPEGDARARRALQQFPPRWAEAREGFLAGGNAPDDINGLIVLFVLGQKLPHVSDAIRHWTAGDEAIAELRGAAERARARLLRGDSEAAEVRELERLMPLANQRLTQLEAAFSHELGEAAKLIRNVLIVLNLGVAMLLVAAGGRFLRRSLLALSQRQREMSALLSSMSDGVLTIDAGYRVVAVNPAAQRLFGRGPAALEGQTLDHFIEDDLRASVAQIEAGAGATAHEVAGRRADGAPLRLEVTLTGVGTVQGQSVAVICRDVSQRHARLERERAEAAQMALDLTRKAHTDALTGLPNRGALEQHLSGAIEAAGRLGQRLVVMFLDLDGFKAVNDNHGHLVGDELLVRVAAALRRSVRQGDAVFRISGDEFVVVALEGSKAGETEALASRLLAAVRQPQPLQEATVRITASIGIACCPEAGEDTRSLLLAADAAMYRAKRQGKDTYRIGAAGFAVLRERPPIVRELERALADDELTLDFQAIVHAGDHTLTGGEALVRWNHPQRGLLPPGLFVPEAEAHGLSDALGHWVLAETTRRLAGREIAPARWLTINLAAAQLLDLNLPRRLDELLRSHALQPQQLGVELTESMSMQDPERCKRVLGGIRELGVHVCMDDFGTGYSSLAQLHRMPIDKLKIDRSFVQHLPADNGALRIVEALIAMSRAMKVGTVAEGVETCAQADILRQLGVDELQGFGIARPLAWEAFCRLPARLSPGSLLPASAEAVS